MRKLIEYVLTSADGIFEDPVGMGVAEHQDEAYLRDGLGLLMSCDAIIFGRGSYEGFAELYAHRSDHKPMWADRLTEITKYVFSTSLDSADWHNSILARDDAVAEVTRLKREPGRNLLLLGHGRLGEALLRAGLIDVIDLTIYPFIVGHGKQFFREGQTAGLRLAGVKTFSEIVKLTYEVESEGDGHHV